MQASVYIGTSLDGYIARKDGSLDWLPQPDSEDASTDLGYQAFMDSVDAVVMGRNTYDMVRSFGGEWPYGAKPVIVLSSGHVEIPTSIAATVESSTSAPTELVAQLASRGLKHLYVDGGAVIQSFMRAGLITQLIITRIPVLIGSGIPLFGPLDQDIRLKHMETKAFGSGMVQSTYKVKSPHQNGS